MKNTITELKNTLEGINSRLDEPADWISNLKDKIAKNTQSGQKEKLKSINQSINKWGQFKGSLGQHQVYQHPYHRDTIRRREGKGLRTYLKK